MPSRKSELSKAVVKLRSSFAENQQNFSNRVGLAINTLARYETSRSPSGYVLVSFEKLAREQGLSDVAQIFRKAIDEELKAAGVNRGAFVGSLRSYFAELFDELEQLSGSNANSDKQAAETLERIFKRLDYPRLNAIKQVIEGLQRLSGLTSPINVHKDPKATLRLVNQEVREIRSTLDVGLPFDDHFNQGTSAS